MPVRPPFDPSREFVGARDFTFLGHEMALGTPFPKKEATERQLRLLYDSRMVNFGEAAADPVTITPLPGGRYEVSAAWLDEPLKIKGRVHAHEAADKLRADGPPPGWIAGGTVLTLEGGDGGWYEITAPWLDEPEKVQGREAAEARQRELHDAGEPAMYMGVTLTEGENGWWEVSANWDPENVVKAHGEAEARELATSWRTMGPPQDPVTITPGENDGEFVITTAWSDETEIVVGEDTANARADEIRKAGPPQGETAQSE